MMAIPEYADMARAYTSLAYKSYQLADKVKDILSQELTLDTYNSRP